MNNKYFMYLRANSWDELKKQESTLTTLAKGRGLEVVDIFVDFGSANNPHRAGFNCMVERIKEGKASGVICTAFDRLTRDLRVFLQLAEEVQMNIITLKIDHVAIDNES